MERFKIPDAIQSLVYKKNKAKALWLISDLSHKLDIGLYAHYYKDFIRYLNNYRVMLLRDWGMYRDALAYTCLECELYPDNANALAFKEYLIKYIKGLTDDSEPLDKPSNKRSWIGVAGMKDLKAVFERDVVLLFTQREIYERYKVPLPNGIMLYGPPGCGKTFIARKLAEEIGFNFIEVTPADLGSIYVHGTQIEIKKLFDEALKKAPTVLFIDEIEGLLPSRNNSDVSFHYKAEVNEFLTQLDQCGKKQIFVVGATNYLRNIDSAILRPGRFDKKIFVGPPDLEARIEALKIHLEGRPCAAVKWVFLAEMTENYTFAELENIVNEAARIAIKQKTQINTNILGTVISKTKPLLNNESITKYFG